MPATRHSQPGFADTDSIITSPDSGAVNRLIIASRPAPISNTQRRLLAALPMICLLLLSTIPAAGYLDFITGMWRIIFNVMAAFGLLALFMWQVTAWRRRRLPPPTHRPGKTTSAPEGNRVAPGVNL